MDRGPPPSSLHFLQHFITPCQLGKHRRAHIETSRRQREAVYASYVARFFWIFIHSGIMAVLFRTPSPARLAYDEGNWSYFVLFIVLFIVNALLYLSVSMSNPGFVRTLKESVTSPSSILGTNRSSAPMTPFAKGRGNGSVDTPPPPPTRGSDGTTSFSYGVASHSGNHPMSFQPASLLPTKAASLQSESIAEESEWRDGGAMNRAIEMVGGGDTNGWRRHAALPPPIPIPMAFASSSSSPSLAPLTSEAIARYQEQLGPLPTPPLPRDRIPSPPPPLASGQVLSPPAPPSVPEASDDDFSVLASEQSRESLSTTEHGAPPSYPSRASSTTAEAYSYHHRALLDARGATTATMAGILQQQQQPILYPPLALSMQATSTMNVRGAGGGGGGGGVMPPPSPAAGVVVQEGKVKSKRYSRELYRIEPSPLAPPPPLPPLSASPLVPPLALDPQRIHSNPLYQTTPPPPPESSYPSPPPSPPVTPPPASPTSHTTVFIADSDPLPPHSPTTLATAAVVRPGSGTIHTASSSSLLLPIPLAPPPPQTPLYPIPASEASVASSSMTPLVSIPPGSTASSRSKRSGSKSKSNALGPGGKHCQVCSIWQPMRVKHCYDCGRCVYRFDHHCGWIGTCVGRDNHALFLWFISTQFSLSLWSLIQVFMAFRGSKGAAHWFKNNTPLLLSALVLLLFTLFLASLFLQHAWLMLTNQTTYEQMKGSSLWYLNLVPENVQAFSKGVVRNIVGFCSNRFAQYWNIQLDEMPSLRELQERSSAVTFCDNPHWSCCG